MLIQIIYSFLTLSIDQSRGSARAMSRVAVDARTSGQYLVCNPAAGRIDLTLTPLTNFSPAKIQSTTKCIEKSNRGT